MLQVQVLQNMLQCDREGLKHDMKDLVKYETFLRVSHLLCKP